MRHRRFEIRLRRELSFNLARESFEPPESIQLVVVAGLRRVQRRAKKIHRLVVGLERTERMAALAAVRQRKARRIAEPARRAMDDRGNQRERLQRTRTQILQ